MSELSFGESKTEDGEYLFFHAGLINKPDWTYDLRDLVDWMSERGLQNQFVNGWPDEAEYEEYDEIVGLTFDRYFGNVSIIFDPNQYRDAVEFKLRWCGV